MNISHRIKRAKQRTYIKYKSTFDPSWRTDSDAQQTSAYLICKRLIEKEGTILLMAPLSGKRYIKQDDGNLFIIIGHDSIQIINHVYSYTIPMSGHTLIKTFDAFDNKLEVERTKLEFDVKSNIQKSLNQIKDELTK